MICFGLVNQLIFQFRATSPSVTDAGSSGAPAGRGGTASTTAGSAGTATTRDRTGSPSPSQVSDKNLTEAELQVEFRA